jgi:SAM-dependent methyltransferase
MPETRRGPRFLGDRLPSSRMAPTDQGAREPGRCTARNGHLWYSSSRVMNPYERMVHLLHRYHDNQRDAGGRVARELLVEGYNLIVDFVDMEVGAPWVHTPRMDQFYSATDSFVVQLLAWHHRPHRIRWRHDISQRIRTAFPDGARVLSLGDGIGFDSLDVVARCPGTTATCFEFDGYSSRFAKRRAEDSAASSRIAFVHELSHIPRGSFDVVICLDVLEHVLDPDSVVRDIAGYLRPQGQVLLSEAFGEVVPAHPTHLRSNLKYAGQTIALLRRHGLHYEETFGGRVYRFARGSPRTAASLAREARADARLRMIGALARLQFKRHYAAKTIDLSELLTIDPDDSSLTEQAATDQ